MIIYIYGSESFTKEIKELLNHSNIKFRLDENGEIKELKTLESLKNAIEDNPKNIYLIDDSKIIKKNTLNQKINFFKPKDGIEQEYLLDHGIGDISVDSMEELSKHIIKKLETEAFVQESNDIQDSIVEIVEDAYEKDEGDEKNYVQLDDELSNLLSNRNEKKSSIEPVIEEIDDLSSFIEQIDEKEIENSEDNQDEDILSSIKDLSFEEDFDIIEEKKEENTQGVDMPNEFAEFDALNEADILAALDGLDNEELSTQPLPSKVQTTELQKDNKSESIDIGSSSVDDIAKLISQLLNNKTLEITVKVKD
ncbi:hypothetical protein [Arcobacter arenosus]|uniref:Uncharacterized protein n=1 Tax=Arcobacter arenosus TaxID=2576037 RepID=A0A5R8Y0X8_9BACT|nr:hypothetical protein [Arcobacter arenosus]TLP38417.1 hypothetical protein FDK22_08070 [Arcobacter arenosus]